MGSCAIKKIGINNIYAGSSSAKGKIERPFRWIQDRLVRECARHHVSNLKRAQELLDEIVYNYNNKKEHSITKEIPIKRFNEALKKGNSAFIPLTKKERSTKYLDSIFHLLFHKSTNGYGVLNFYGYEIEAGLLPRTKYLLHLVPEASRPRLTILLNGEIVLSITLKPDKNNLLVKVTKSLDESSTKGRYR